MPKPVNSTLMSLIPKKKNAANIRDFRPIACCNALYKCVAKVLSNRLVSCLPDVTSQNQSTFVKGRQIGDNIHLKHMSPRCAIKIDLRKAFDSVHIPFLLVVLKAMRFPPTFITWIKSCLQTVMLGIGINGGIVGNFESKKGLRQCDPLSPGLFVVVMETLHCLFANSAAAGHIPFHPKCKKFGIVELCFADDLLVFKNGTESGVNGIRNVLAEFYQMSGLQLNPDKSEIFFSRSVSSNVRMAIVRSSGFIEGLLPVRYLGVPLTSGKLRSADCGILVERITKKIPGWKVKCLSYAGRLNLVKSVS
ncbi:LINE-1 reverse transcriptase homolog [Linum perenne]